MRSNTTIICAGSVLWDVIGRTASHMKVGSDVPGRITRIPGGVAMNIAMTLRQFGMSPVLLTAIGKDAEGIELLAHAAQMGLGCDYVYVSEDLPTDVYMAIEGANGLIAAIADAHSLEAAGDKILRPLRDGTLGSQGAPFSGTMALDGNLTVELLHTVAQAPEFARTDLRVAPASPGKAKRLLALVGHPKTTFYVNKEEAGLICDRDFETAAQAASALIDLGIARALVTDGAAEAADADTHDVLTASPPAVMVTRVTGAGDTFMAAHIAAEMAGLQRMDALSKGQKAAATYVSGETPL